MNAPLSVRAAAEMLGTALLLATVVGSGIMGERLSGGSVGLALLANAIATGAVLVVLILVFGPISGAHFNPAVTGVSVLRRDLDGADAAAYVGAQIGGAILGVWVAHLMFDLPMIQVSGKIRSGVGQWIAEMVATFGLVVTIQALAPRGNAIAAAGVGLYILGAYWFTASTSFANPAVTLARGLTDSFAGIAPAGIPAFVAAQLVGAAAGLGVARLFWPSGPHARAGDQGGELTSP